MMTAILALALALSGNVGTVAIGGLATWYDAPPGQAAAGPDLRAALGPNWRGQIVTVSHDGRSVSVKLSDFCACGDRGGKPTLIDLDDASFARLAPLSAGVIEVSIEFGGTIALPPTDTAPVQHRGAR